MDAVRYNIPIAVVDHAQGIDDIPRTVWPSHTRSHFASSNPEHIQACSVQDANLSNSDSTVVERPHSQQRLHRPPCITLVEFAEEPRPVDEHIVLSGVSPTLLP